MENVFMQYGERLVLKEKLFRFFTRNIYVHMRYTSKSFGTR